MDRNRSQAHLTYQMEDLESWHRRLTEHGASLLDSIPIPGFDRFELRDPFGNRLELMEKK